MSKIVFVNPNKLERAKVLLDLLDGKKISPDKISFSEQDRLKEFYEAGFEADEVDKKDRLEYIYVKLGGLVRTEAEQSAAEKKAAKMKKEFEKKSEADKKKLEDED